MISFNEARGLVLAQHLDLGIEEVPLLDALGRILAEDIRADRDFPPFNRATKDGIAIAYEAIEEGRLSFEIKGVLPAGEPTIALVEPDSCIEIMTGAVLPFETDTVVMYEDLRIQDDIATLEKIPLRGQNIHLKASDREKGDVVLHENTLISPAEIGVLATVGMSKVRVKKLPRIAVISTGNELVDIDQQPQLHQIRRSNTYSLYSGLQEHKITPLLLHIADDVDLLRQKLGYVMDEMDVLLLSGGVSKGKFDFVPKVMEELGVETIFHRVAQRPGKPFWFGKNSRTSTLVFSFPGNPVSTFLNYHLYFVPWLWNILGKIPEKMAVKLNSEFENPGNLTIFKGVVLDSGEGDLSVSEVESNGSGDLLHLSGISGFIQLDPGKATYEKGSLVPYIPTKNILNL
jgi:molybdopterin molybdotransferase